MNIFRLHDDPEIAAQMHCDKHIPKMILETAQMLSTAWRMSDNDYADKHALYKAAYKNHPSTVWVRHGILNSLWTRRCLNICAKNIRFDIASTMQVRDYLKPLPMFHMKHAL